MNIETSKVNSTKNEQKQQTNNNNINNSSAKFTDELNVLKPEYQNNEILETNKPDTEYTPIENNETHEPRQHLNIINQQAIQPVLQPKQKNETNFIPENINNSNLTELVQEELKQTQCTKPQDTHNNFETVIKQENNIALQKNISKSKRDENIFAQNIEQNILTEPIEEKPSIEKESNGTVLTPVENIVTDLSDIVEELNKKTQQVTNKPKDVETNAIKEHLQTVENLDEKTPIEPIQDIKKHIKEVSTENPSLIKTSNEEVIKELAKPTQKPIQKLENPLNQSEEIITKPIKKPISTVDKKEEKTGEELINNEINIQENKEVLPQMSTNMNFNSDGQPFSSFMEEENKENKTQSILGNSAKDLAEEAAILSTMAENVAIANKNIAKKTVKKEAEEAKKPSPLTQVFDKTVEPEVKTVTRNEGIKKVDTKSGVTIETVVKFDNVIMNEADVEVFANLVENGQVDLKNLAPEAAQKTIQVSKTLANMLAKAQETQQPVRIDFDNDISVIIRISKDGKVSAEFLPSSQIAEAYLRENLPLLRQRFDDNNIKYDDLSQRNQRENREKENNRKKGRNDE